MIGLFAVMFLEGSSLPFPGVALVLTYGYLLPFSYVGTAFTAAGMSVIYCLASLIPYFLGRKLKGLFPKRMQKGLDKARKFFLRYGIWSVALSRPFGLGNYISYVAGMSKIRLVPYLFLTLAGIYPWAYVMLVLGNYFNGSYKALQSFYNQYSIYLYAAAGAALALMTVYFYIRHKKRKMKPAVKEGG